MKALNPERQALALQYLPFARRLAMPYKAMLRRLRDDIDGAAFLGLCQAAATFDPDGGAAFKTHAYRRVKGEIADMLRKLRPKGYRDGRDRPPAVETLPDAEMLPGAGAGVGAAIEEADAAEAILRRLPRKHAAVMRKIHVDDMSQCEAAEAIGMSQSRVSFLTREAAAMLRDDRP